MCECDHCQLPGHWASQYDLKENSTLITEQLLAEIENSERIDEIIKHTLETVSEDNCVACAIATFNQATCLKTSSVTQSKKDLIPGAFLAKGDDKEVHYRHYVKVAKRYKEMADWVARSEDHGEKRATPWLQKSLYWHGLVIMGEEKLEHMDLFKCDNYNIIDEVNDIIFRLAAELYRCGQKNINCLTAMAICQPKLIEIIINHHVLVNRAFGITEFIDRLGITLPAGDEGCERAAEQDSPNTVFSALTKFSDQNRSSHKTDAQQITKGSINIIREHEKEMLNSADKKRKTMGSFATDMVRECMDYGVRLTDIVGDMSACVFDEMSFSTAHDASGFYIKALEITRTYNGGMSLSWTSEAIFEKIRATKELSAKKHMEQAKAYYTEQTSELSNNDVYCFAQSIKFTHDCYTDILKLSHDITTNITIQNQLWSALAFVISKNESVATAELIRCLEHDYEKYYEQILKISTHNKKDKLANSLREFFSYCVGMLRREDIDSKKNNGKVPGFCFKRVVTQRMSSNWYLRCFDEWINTFFEKKSPTKAELERITGFFNAMDGIPLTGPNSEFCLYTARIGHNLARLWLTFSHGKSGAFYLNESKSANDFAEGTLYHVLEKKDHSEEKQKQIDTLARGIHELSETLEQSLLKENVEENKRKDKNRQSLETLKMAIEEWQSSLKKGSVDTSELIKKMPIFLSRYQSLSATVNYDQSMQNEIAESRAYLGTMYYEYFIASLEAQINTINDWLESIDVTRDNNCYEMKKIRRHVDQYNSHLSHLKMTTHKDHRKDHRLVELKNKGEAAGVEYSILSIEEDLFIIDHLLETIDLMRDNTNSTLDDVRKQIGQVNVKLSRLMTTTNQDLKKDVRLRELDHKKDRRQTTFNQIDAMNKKIQLAQQKIDDEKTKITATLKNNLFELMNNDSDIPYQIAEFDALVDGIQSEFESAIDNAREAISPDPLHEIKQNKIKLEIFSKQFKKHISNNKAFDLRLMSGLGAMYFRLYLILHCNLCHWLGSDLERKKWMIASSDSNLGEVKKNLLEACGIDQSSPLANDDWKFVKSLISNDCIPAYLVCGIFSAQTLTKMHPAQRRKDTSQPKINTDKQQGKGKDKGKSKGSTGEQSSPRRHAALAR